MGNRLETTVLFARWTQILCGLGLIIACSFGTWYSAIDYYDSSSTVLFSATAACGSYLVPIGGIGFVRFYSPEAVHWRLGLAFDIVALILACISWVLPIIAMVEYVSYAAFACCEANIALAALATFFSIFPIIETSRLKRMGRLSGSKAGAVDRGNHDWFHMEDSQRPGPVLQQQQQQQQQQRAEEVASSSAFAPLHQQHQPALRQVVEEGDDLDVEALPVRDLDDVVGK